MQNYQARFTSKTLLKNVIKHLKILENAHSPLNCFIDGLNTFYRGSEDWFVGYPANSPPTRFNWTDFLDPKYRIGLLSDMILSFESVWTFGINSGPTNAEFSFDLGLDQN